MNAQAFDLAIVGAGVAGWTAARRAQQLGLRTVVLEKWPEAPGLGNGRMSGGIFHAGYMDPLADPDTLVRGIVRATAGTADPDVARAWARTNPRALRFLEAEGGRFIVDQRTKGEEQWHLHCLQPPGRGDVGNSDERWRGAGPDQLFGRMHRSFVDAGGEFRAGQRASEIIITDRRVSGVAVTDGRTGTSTVEARSVLVADGGYHSNRRLAARYFGGDQYLLRASAQNTGDGLEMCTAVGAATRDLDQFYGHFAHRDADSDPRFFLRPTLDIMCEAGMVVTGRGEWLHPSGPTFMHVGHDVLRSETPLGCWAICDRAGWETFATMGSGAPNPTCSQMGARVVSADSVSALARGLSVAEDRLTEAVGRFNSWARPGGFGQPDIQVAHPIVRPLTLEKPPFIAIPIIVGITFPLGGVLVNGNAQVVSRELRPIPGLYAAGNAVGGLQGGPDHGYAGGWSQATTLALLAAEDAAGSAAASSRPLAQPVAR